MDELERLKKQNEILKEEINGLIEELIDRKAREEEASAIALAVKHSLGGIVIGDKDFNIKYANPAAIKMWGYDNEGEVIGKNVRDFFYKISSEEEKRARKIFFEKGYWEGEIIGIKKDKSTFNVSTTQNQIRDRFGDFIGIVSSFLDITEYRKALKGIAESELRYRLVLDHMGDAIHVVNRDLKITMINESFKNWVEELGINLGNAVGKNIFDVFPFLTEKVRDEYKLVMKTGDDLITEEENFLSGRRVITETRKIPIFEDNKVSNIVTVIRDITKRKVSEEELKRSEEKFRVIADSVPVGVFIHIAGEIKYCGGEAARILGYDDPEKIIDRNVIEFISEEDRELVIDRYRRRMLGEDVPTGYEIKAIKKGGETLPVLIYGSKISYLGEDAIQGVFIDISEMKKAEEALRESEERYRTLVESSNDGIAVVKDERLVFFNNIFKGLLGYSEEELNNIHISNLIHPDDIGLVMDNYNKRLEGKDAPILYEFRGLTKEKDIISVEMNVAISDWEGSPATYCFIRDITERKRAEEAIRESEEKWRDLFENSIEAVFTVDIDGNFTSINHAMESLSGYRREELIGKSYTYFTKSDMAEDIFRVYNRLFLTGEPVKDIVYNVARKNGEERIIEGYVNIIKKGNSIVGFQGTLRDITEKKAAEEALRKSEERFRNLFETSRDVIYISSVEGMFIDINPAGKELFGYTKEELLKLNILDLYKDKGDRKKFQKTITENGFVKDYEIIFKKKDGTPVNCLLTSTIVKDKEGKVIGYQGIMKDITEKKNLEAQLVQTQKMEAIGTLAGGMAHNFNNILVGIMGYSEYLITKSGKSDPNYKALKTIHESTLRASELTRQLLNIARGGEYKLMKVSLNHIVKRVLPLISGTFDKSIEIENVLDPKIMVIKGDIGQLEQCLLNISINARDAMQGGGKLIIETSNQRLDEEFVRVHIGSKKGDYVVLSITDTGMGLAPEIRDHIFEPFFTTKKKSGGTGMGLATVYGIVKNHDGFVTVYSEPGQGTTFKLYFPAIREEVQESPDFEDRRGLGGDETILLVDDEEVVRDLWGAVLGELGYKILTAGSGEEALKIMKKKKDEIDLVILDYIMPGLGGKETFSRLKEVAPDIKVLISSGYSKNGKVSEILDEGSEGFIQKPSQIREITEMIRKILDEKE